ncbi:uncharacterized protein L3040_002182 [Drepanopeziza brunnea f. sp. 'multigermtubi']|uniref:uncharacterized protein n=1 Tax=Drepanopeziza brunnea f. sp. 'multigermtubi' TaxID=698441 RepID=UPI00238A5432|nr:hypothetical protein L3040_002182 [Drepanopeziza brunnea f. sp. 'multigermtubi']
MSGKSQAYPGILSENLFYILAKICSNYPDEYWTAYDESGEYPHEFHRDFFESWLDWDCFARGPWWFRAWYIRSNHDAADNLRLSNDNPPETATAIRFPGKRCLSPFFIDFDKSKQGLEPKHTSKMEGRAVDANEVFFDNYSIPGDSLIGNEDQGFKIVLHGMTAARCLLAGETLGLSYAALYRTSTHAKDRVVFGHPIDMNQGI